MRKTKSSYSRDTPYGGAGAAIFSLSLSLSPSSSIHSHIRVAAAARIRAAALLPCVACCASLFADDRRGRAARLCDREHRDRYTVIFSV